MSPKVSVIVPVYNAQEYLGQCLDAILLQTLQDIEVICVDDGSTDDSPNILNTYAFLDERIKVIHQENAGAAAARNRGMKEASGEFVCFMQSEDFYPENDVLQTLYEEIKMNSLDVCCGELVLFDPMKQRFSQNFEKNSGFLFDKNEVFDYSFWQFDEGIGRFIFNREFLSKKCSFFPEYAYGFEECFLVAACHAARKIYGIHKIIYAKRHGKTPQFHWTKEKVKDYCCALIDNLKLAHKNAYHYLKDLSLIKLMDIFSMTKKYLSEDEQLDLLRKTDFLCEDVRTKVSVIIPVYNEEKYLSACLDSVLNQTLKDIEIICVDDGSTDSSSQILKQYAQMDSRIKIITQKNQGLGAARNTAFQRANGEYIQYVDSDDKITQNACEYLYLYAKLFSLDMLAFAAKNHDVKTNEIYDEPYTTFAYLPKNFPSVFNISMARDFLPQMAVTSALTFYRHEFLKDQDIQWESLHYEDTLFFTESILQANRIGILEKQFYIRLMHDDSITGSINNNYGDYCDILLKTFDFIKKLSEKENQYRCSISTLENGKIQVKFINPTINKDLLRQYVHYFLLKAHLILTTKISLESQAKFTKKFYNLCLRVLSRYHIDLPPTIESFASQYTRNHSSFKKKLTYFISLYFSKILRDSYSLSLFYFKSYPGGFVFKLLGIPLLSKKPNYYKKGLLG